jgi:ribonucleotide reductase alpha subunit
MLNQLLEIVKQNAGDAIIKNPEVPNAKNEQAMKLAANSLLKNLKGEAGGGNLNTVLDIFKGGSTASGNPVVNNITKNVAGELAKKLGISQAAATGIVNQLIPVVMSQLAKKTNDPNDKSIDLKSIAKTLSSKGGAGGLLGTLGGLLGKR